MTRSRAVHYLLCLALLLAMLGGLITNQAVTAQEEPPPEEKLELSCSYPVLRDVAGKSFEFEVSLNWLGSDFRTFDLTTTAPPKWSVEVVGGYPEKEIPAIGLEPGKQYPEKIKVRLVPLAGELPEPGDYVVTLEASSDNIKETIELKAIVTALYRFAFYTATGRLNTEVTAGEDNHLALRVANHGSSVIEKIDLLSTKPSGWTVTFTPDEVDSLEPGLAQDVDVVIKPPRKAIAGDYMVTMKAISKDLNPREIELRVTVLTPTVLGWVGILVVLAVIAGLAVMFRRLGRR